MSLNKNIIYVALFIDAYKEAHVLSLRLKWGTLREVLTVNMRYFILCSKISFAGLDLRNSANSKENRTYWKQTNGQERARY